MRVVGDGGRELAGKILHASHENDERAQRRFSGEAALLAGLRHPNLVEIHGLADIDGERVLLMELVPGPSLAHIVARDAPLSPERAARLGRDIASGLAAAHRAGLIHRDLKPANALLDASGAVKLVDFGLARATSFAGVDQAAFAVVGTPDYMAPESIDPLATDTRSDLYALGCILFEMLTGAPPYSGATAYALLKAHRDAPVPPLQGPPALVELTRRLLAKSPVDRPQSAAAVAEELATAADPERPTALVPATAAAADSSCTACGAPVRIELPVCFACGAPRLRVESGPWSVAVVGPGERADKLEPELRLRLLDWLAANPQLGLDSLLNKQVPRVPFVFARGIDERGAGDVVAALRGLGLEAETYRGRWRGHKGVRGKSRVMAMRGMAVGAGSTVAFASSTHGLLTIGAALVGGVVGWLGAQRAVARASRRSRAALPSGLAAAVSSAAGVATTIAARRHRESLRGIIERSLALVEAAPPDQRAVLELDLSNLVNLAAVAASRTDEIESALAAGDMRDVDDAARRRMVERDTWAARLLEVTAFLDALRARYASAQGQRGGDDLEELRLHIEALEEVEAL